MANTTPYFYLDYIFSQGIFAQDWSYQGILFQEDIQKCWLTCLKRKNIIHKMNSGIQCTPAATWICGGCGIRGFESLTQIKRRCLRRSRLFSTCTVCTWQVRGCWFYSCRSRFTLLFFTNSRELWSGKTCTFLKSTERFLLCLIWGGFSQ